jgi:hypothetical protein
MGPCGDLCDCVQKDHVHENPLYLTTAVDGDMYMTAEVVGIRWVWVRLGWYTCARIRPLPSVPTLLVCKATSRALSTG